MNADIKVPAMGESISEATIGTILKPSGSVVEADEEILELETDKVNQVLYAPQKGVLQLTVQPGQVVKIGDVIGHVEEAGTAAKGVKEPAKTGDVAAEIPVLKPAASQPPKEEKRKSEEPPKEEQRGAARITKEAFLSDIKGQKQPPQEKQESKPEKRGEEPQPIQKSTDQRETRKKLSKVRRVIGERLVDVLHTTAMLTTFNEVDMSQIISLREKYKDVFMKEHGVKLGFLSFFVKAVVSALTEFPDLNSYIEGEDLVHREYYNIGIAVGTDKGLFVPVVKDCEKLSYAEIEKAIETYALKAREGTIAVDDLKGGGFTITNGGVYGSLLSTPILNPPQCGILGMHKIEKRPVVVNDEVVIRPMMYLALSYDHRIVDGKEAVSFLVHIKNHLEDPARQLLEV